MITILSLLIKHNICNSLTLLKVELKYKCYIKICSFRPIFQKTQTGPEHQKDRSSVQQSAAVTNVVGPAVNLTCATHYPKMLDMLLIIKFSGS